MRRASFKRFCKDTSGAAALEFALVAVPLVMFTFGIMEVGRALFMQQSLSHATDIAARMLYLDPDTPVADLRAAIVDELFLGDPDLLDVTLSAANTVTGTARFRTMTMSVDYDFLSIVPGILTDQISMQFQRSVTVDGL